MVVIVVHEWGTLRIGHRSLFRGMIVRPMSHQVSPLSVRVKYSRQFDDHFSYAARSPWPVLWCSLRACSGVRCPALAFGRSRLYQDLM